MFDLRPRWFAFAVAFAAVLAPPALAQRPLTLDDCDAWKSLRGTTLSDAGDWVAFQIEPQVGDGELVVRQTAGEVVHRHARGQGARFSSDGRFCVFTIAPSKVEARQKKVAELAQKKPGTAAPRGRGAAAPEPGAGGGGGGEGDGETPKPSDRGELAILDLTTGALEVVGKVKGFALAEGTTWLVYHRDADKDADKDGGKADEPPAEGGGEPGEAKAAEAAAPRAGRRGGKAAADPLAKKRQQGSPLCVRDLATGTERRLDDVVGYGLMPKASWLYFHTSAKKPVEGTTYGLFATRLDGSATVALVEGFADFGAFTADRRGSALAFTCTKDDFAADKPRKDLWLWTGDGPARRIVHPQTDGVPAGMVVGDGLQFARDGQLLLLSLAPAPEELPPILPEDKVAMDLWHWNDGELQTAQQKRGARPLAQRAVFHLAEQRLVALGGEPGESVRLLTPDGSRALVHDGDRYDKVSSWDGRYQDVWLANTVDGSRTKVLTRLRGSAANSPSGRYLVWFGDDQHWWSLDTVTMARRDLTGALPVAFHRADDDRPEPDPAHGLAGWTTDDAAVLLYDEFDLWQVSPATGDAVNVTDGYGRQNHLRLRVQRLPRDRDDDDDDGTLAGTLVLTATDVEDLSEGICTDVLGAVQRPRRLLRLDEKLGDLQRARKAERWVFTRSTFAQFGDLWTCDGSFAAPQRLSDANPQQQQFRWGSARLVRWTSTDGVPLKGVLVVPDGFDPSKQYPMLVYFYERLSQNLHAYVAPAPGTSPNAAHYVSNGYLWFMPDIVYTPGYPGESCVKCVLSGVQSLIGQGFVDARAIGAAGHSWGGYQTAFLATRTNLFAAVESGAPVCNMISAYGGIRYESGVSRQFQYEQTQSRIGGTPWEYPLRYWENSPIFFADKVQTPVLILHNDKDGAVPWTQGIEFFTALRRLGKEAYLCNYNGEPHGLQQRQNKLDWSRRMAEYFDHHLRGAPMPKWMQDGVPFRDREREKLPFAKSRAEVEAAAAAAKAAQPVEAVGERAATEKPESTGDAGGAPAVEPAAPAPEATRRPRANRRTKAVRIVFAAPVDPQSGASATA